MELVLIWISESLVSQQPTPVGSLLWISVILSESERNGARKQLLGCQEHLFPPVCIHTVVHTQGANRASVGIITAIHVWSLAGISLPSVCVRQLAQTVVSLWRQIRCRVRSSRPQMSQIHLACVVRDWHMCHYCLAERWSVPLMRGFNADGRGGAFLPPRCRALRGVSSLRFLPSPLLGTKSAADQSFLKRWAADDRVPPNSDRHRFLCRRWHVVGRNNFTWTWKDFKEINVVSLLVFSFRVRVCKKAGLPLVSSPASLFTALY